MKDRIKKIIKPLILSAAVLFVLFWFVFRPKSIDDYFKCISYAVSGVTILYLIYERLLWRYIPWNRPPILKKRYNGTISYWFKNQKKTKSIEITVKQTWLSISIKTKTDINSSVSISGSILTEYGEDVLYYNYITNPSAVKQEDNPIQYGTCRMILDNDNSVIKGKYWTTSKTAGDITWEALRE